MDLFTETIRPSIRGCCKLLWAFFLIPQRMKKGQESQLGGISPVALSFSLPVLTCTAWQRTVCIFVQPLNAATHRWHLRRP